MKFVAFQQTVALLLMLRYMELSNGKYTTRLNILLRVNAETISVPLRIKQQVGVRRQEIHMKYENEKGFRFNPRHYDWLEKKYYRTRENQVLTSGSGIEFTREQIDQVEEEINALSSTVSEIELDTPRKDAFIGHCEDYILSETVIGDDLISQVDTTNFLIEYCIDVQVCEPDYNTTFEALDPKLQLSFTRFNCPFRFDGPQDQECLDELEAQGDEFGYVISPNEDMDALRDRVAEYCSWLWHFGTEFHGGTEAPTSTPSTYPSIAPTGKPSTLAPSPGPSNTPTGIPSSFPTVTVVPTKAPSGRPTLTGSFRPSQSVVPSMHPSKNPSSFPTQSPSTVPSMHPSVSPSGTPSDPPTFLISNRPTTVPSSMPTAVPSSMPTIVPSTSPTHEPSTVPSNPPSVVPSVMPSIHPTDRPTVGPSVQPTSLPTNLPSSVPSMMPSARPSHRPSVFPSEVPTTVPSNSPSVRPSGEPSMLPSEGPSVSPSQKPTSEPSPSPSDRPSARPSISPSLKPSVYPSPLPTFVPSNSPSGRPSTRPSTVPTFKPSLSPSEVPTFVPSMSPSVTPSRIPSTAPSFKPSSYPSQVPTFVPSNSPSVKPSRIPSTIPTESPSRLPSGQPSVAPSEVPTVANSISPTMTPAPSASPTEAVPFKVDFTYITGFNDTAISASSLDDAERYVFVMDDIRETIRKVLALDDITRRNRRLIGFRGDDPQFSQIYHKRVIDEDSCPNSFTESVSCVRVVTEVIVHANPNKHDQESVGTSVRTPIKNSMSNDLFLRSTEEKELKEIIYLGDGLILAGDTDDVLGNDRGNLGDGGVAGIAVGSIFLVAGIALFAFTRSRAEDDRSVGPFVESNDDSSASELDPEITVPVIENKSLPILKESKSFEEVNVSRSAQLDTETGAVIPAVTSGQSDRSANSSNYSDSDKEGEILISRLDAAVSAGDWAAVAAIAADLSTADEASTMSSVNTGKLSNSFDRKGLSKEDAKRAAKLDELIAEGDWNAVGMTAAAFDSASSTSGSEQSKDKNAEGSKSAKKRSLIDFIAGPWQSSAASRAMIDDEPDSQIKELNISSRSDGVSSLSGGLTPDRKKELDLEVGAVQNRGASQEDKSSESTPDSDDKKPILETKPEKKGWKERIPSILRKKVVEPQAAPETFALHEDSSVSSWSRGSPESQGFTPYGDGKAKSDSIPEEMKAFGEDFGLAAAELAMRQEEEAKEVSEDEKISQKSSNSLRDELDKAIETGDWAAVEAQTNKMLDVNMDDLKIEDTRKKRKNSHSSYDDSDDESRDGWSTSEKSVGSGESELIDDERIAMLEKLIETDDWQGIVTSSRIHNKDDSSMASSIPGESQVDGLLSLATEKDGDFGDRLDEDLSLATDVARTSNP